MLSSISERKISFIRVLLVFVWFSLFTLLCFDIANYYFFDEKIIESTQNSSVYFQGELIQSTHFSQANRIFWSMIVPLVPLFLLTFGHSAWRRICPLSAIMQIPRKLNFQRKSKVSSLHLSSVSLSPSSWLAKNYWYCQFLILVIAVVGRILFYNADPVGLLSLSAVLIVSALMMGYMFSGKTWCHYICPLSPVQKFYAGPSAVFEKKSHLQNTQITQSMCRTKDNKSNCVACKPNCPDIDLEKNYWSELELKGRRFFYYGFPGLIVGYYLYYYLYSGSWDYIFSGQPVKDYAQLSSVLAPGLYFNQMLYAIPKLIAAPLVIGLCILATYFIGRFIQSVIHHFRLRRGKPLSKKEYLHYSFIISVFISFNVFYIFSGRSNINILPTEIVRLIDFSLVSFSVIWAIKSFRRSEQEYKIEAVGKALRKSIKKAPIQWSEVLDKRSVVDLGYHEIYALAKVMPKINKRKAKTIYEDVLSDTYYRGDLDCEQSIDVINDLKKSLGISESEHDLILTSIKNSKIEIKSV